jgi:hypothetical protein
MCTQCKVMRITITQVAQHRCFVFLFVMVFFGSMVFPSLAAAPLQPLIIEVYDSETSNALQSDIVFEGKLYDIVIGTEDAIGFAVNVTITVSYDPVSHVTSNETPFITIQAPPWNDKRTFIINATKQGYQSVEKVLTVMKGALSMRMDRSAVEEKEEFQVTIRDQDNIPVEGAVVFIDPDGTLITTDAQGIAYLGAPEVAHNRNITIKTTKDGYINSSATILVESVGGTLPVIGNGMLMQLAPILFAAVAVIFAVFYVRWRKRAQRDLPSQQTKPGTPPRDAPGKPVDARERPIINDPVSYRVSERSPTGFSSPSSKVEEIRIPLQEKRKETTVLTAETSPEMSAPHDNKDENEWFKGQEYMRYKLDEMTGSIDRKNEGKWFEGERNIESKVDEALKKQSKRKKVEPQEVK